MKELTKADQEVLLLLSEGVAEREICIRLKMTPKALERSLKRIEARAQKSPDAGRLYERALKKQSENTNAALVARVHALMDVLPHAVLVVDARTGLIREFNLAACELFGYASEELKDLSVEELVPAKYRVIHPAYRIGFLSSVRRREMGYHPPIFGLCRDGKEIEMAIALTATTANDDVMVVCTERSRWEGDLLREATTESRG